MEYAARGVSAARLRSHRLVGSRTAVPRAGLATRKAWVRRASRDRVDSGGDVPTGVGRYGGRRRCAAGPRSCLRRRRGQRLGGGAAAAGVDAGEDRQTSATAARQRQLTPGERTL